MIVRAMPKSMECLNPSDICCDERRKEIDSHYQKIKKTELRLDTSCAITVEWACTFCETWHEIHAYREQGKNTYVGINFVDIDEQPVI